MRDYAELVKALRYCSTNDSDTPCNKQCPYYDKRDGYECIWEMMRKTADAIEELVAAVPKWISVEERLPGKDDMVFFYYEWTGQSGTVYKEVSLSTLGEIRHFGFKLIAWMPLPKPPKESP